MKQIVFFLICFNSIFYCIKAATVHCLTCNPQDMSWSITDIVDRYYYTYFDYPQDNEDLIDFAWDMIKNNVDIYILNSSDEYDSRYLQYEDFILSSKRIIEVLKYLETNTENIKIEVEDNIFRFRCSTDGLFVEYIADACSDINNIDSKIFRHDQRIFFYDKNNREIVNLNYNLELTEQLKRLRNIFFSNKQKNDHIQYLLVKYIKGSSKLNLLCHCSEIDDNDKYLIHTRLLLDTFFTNKDVDSAILLIPVIVKE